MLEVRVRCGGKKGGGAVEDVGKSDGMVVEMSLVMVSWRGCEGGGTSQSEEPGMLGCERKRSRLMRRWDVLSERL